MINRLRCVAVVGRLPGLEFIDKIFILGAVIVEQTLIFYHVLPLAENVFQELHAFLGVQLDPLLCLFSLANKRIQRLRVYQ